MKSCVVEPNEQIDIEELLREYKIMDLGSLKCYLKELYRVL